MFNSDCCRSLLYMQRPADIQRPRYSAILSGARCVLNRFPWTHSHALTGRSGCFLCGSEPCGIQRLVCISSVSYLSPRRSDLMCLTSSISSILVSRFLLDIGKLSVDGCSNNADGLLSTLVVSDFSGVTHTLESDQSTESLEQNDCA